MTSGTYRGRCRCWRTVGGRARLLWRLQGASGDSRPIVEPSTQGLAIVTKHSARQHIDVGAALASCALVLAACGGANSDGNASPPPTSGTSPSTTTAAPPVAGTWSSGVQVSPSDLLESISCVSSSFCMATGDEDNGSGAGSAFTYSNGSWSSGVQLSATDLVGDVSCASESFCVAVGENGSEDQPRSYSFTYSNGSWSSEQPLSTAFAAYSVSCPSAALCVAVGPGPTNSTGGDLATYANGAWSSPVALPGMSDNAEVSCVSASLCQITGSSVSGTTGTAVSYSNGDLGTAQSLPDVYSFRGASCSTSGLCMVVGSNQSNQASGFVGVHGAWQQLQTGSTTGSLSDFDTVSCVNANFCMLEGVGDTYTYSPGSLRSLDNQFPNNSLITDLTCTSVVLHRCRQRQLLVRGVCLHLLDLRRDVVTTDEPQNERPLSDWTVSDEQKPDGYLFRWATTLLNLVIQAVNQRGEAGAFCQLYQRGTNSKDPDAWDLTHDRLGHEQAHWQLLGVLMRDWTGLEGSRALSLDLHQLSESSRSGRVRLGWPIRRLGLRNVTRSQTDFHGKASPS